VRRLLTACAVGTLGVASLAAVGWLAVVALGVKVPSVLASAPAEMWQSAVAMIAPGAGQNGAQAAVPAKATVIAQGIVARTLAHDVQTNLYLTTPTSPNRVFTLATASPSENSANPIGNINAAAEAAAAAANAVARMVPFAGSGQKGSLGDSGTALLAQFDLKTDSIVMRSGIAVAPDGTTFVADTLNGTIRKISSSGSTGPGIVSSIAGRWAAAGSALLVEPVGIALDRAGNLYIADHAAGAVYLVRAATSASPGALEIFAHVMAPGSIAAAPDGSKVFVASPDTGKLFSIVTKTRAISAIAGFELAAGVRAPNWTVRSSGSYCGVTAETAPETCPSGLAADGRGNLFIADATLGEIFRVDAKTGASKLMAKGLTAPGDISFDAGGNLFVADQGSDRILEFQSMGSPLSTLSITAPAPLPPPTSPEVCTALTYSGEIYSFCNEPVDGVTGTEPFTLTNNSAAAVNSLAWSIAPASSPSNFSIAGTTCTATLAAGASCTLNVAFTPQQSGEDDAAVTVTDLAGDTASSEVGGTGTDFELQLAATQTSELSVEQGNGVTFNLQVVPDAIFSGNVTFVCPEPATVGRTLNGFVPPYTSCTINPVSAVVMPNTPVPFTITFVTTYNYLPPTVGAVPGGSMRGPNAMPPSAVAKIVTRMQRFPALAVALALFALVLVFVAPASCRQVLRFVLAAGAAKKATSTPAGWKPAFRKPAAQAKRGSQTSGFRLQFATLVFTFTLAALVLLGACHKNYVNPAIETTPEGITTMNVTATSQGASRGVPITLDVVKHVPTLPGVVSGGKH
jgi:sugar lactone lactonase YvrE